METTTVTRAELYQLVWKQPMQHLAKEYGLSDVGLAKICRKHDIPRPPRGHWAKLQFGKKSPRLPLPDPDRNDDIVLQDSSSYNTLPPDVREAKDEQLAKAEKDDSKIVVADSLRGCHKLVSAANQEFQHAKAGDRKFLIRPDKCTLDVHVSKSGLRRALLIMDALLKALEQLGHDVSAGPKVTILGATIGFGISEKMRVKKQESKEELDLIGRYEFGHSRFDQIYEPSGQYELSITETGYWLSGVQKTWRDTKKKKLEDRLDKFIAGLIETAARVKQRDEEKKIEDERRRQEALRQEELAHQRAEMKQQYKEEKERVETLMKQAAIWNKAQTLRNFIEFVKESHAGGEPVDPQSELAGWMSWAIEQADRLDPLCESPPSILDDKSLEEKEQPQRTGYGYGRGW